MVRQRPVLRGRLRHDAPGRSHRGQPVLPRRVHGRRVRQSQARHEPEDRPRAKHAVHEAVPRLLLLRRRRRLRPDEARVQPVHDGRRRRERRAGDAHPSRLVRRQDRARVRARRDVHRVHSVHARHAARQRRPQRGAHGHRGGAPQLGVQGAAHRRVHDGERSPDDADAQLGERVQVHEGAEGWVLDRARQEHGRRRADADSSRHHVDQVGHGAHRGRRLHPLQRHRHEQPVALRLGDRRARGLDVRGVPAAHRETRHRRGLHRVAPGSVLGFQKLGRDRDGTERRLHLPRVRRGDAQEAPHRRTRHALRDADGEDVALGEG
mmetsp:Transcript_12361/g.44464  ORF Transcript_12361/g.44464 Transcript_12361/m.44464 type:complete len:322 (-) Transcript_12361:3643-4608(-)